MVASFCAIVPKTSPPLCEGTVTNTRTNSWFFLPLTGSVSCEKSRTLYSILGPHGLLKKQRDDHLFIVNFYPHRTSWNADPHPVFWQPGFWYIIFYISQYYLLNTWLLEEGTRHECSVTDTAVLELIIDLLSINQPTIHHLANYPLAITYQPIIYQPLTTHEHQSTNQPTNPPTINQLTNQPPTNNQLTNQSTTNQTTSDSFSFTQVAVRSN